MDLPYRRLDKLLLWIPFYDFEARWQNEWRSREKIFAIFSVRLLYESLKGTYVNEVVIKFVP